jgi:hypothetical protein
MPPPYKRIATEEAWAPAELLDTYRSMASRKSIDDPGFIVLWNRLGARAVLSERLADIGERRIADMDSSGIDLQILSLTSPGCAGLRRRNRRIARRQHQRPGRGSRSQVPHAVRGSRGRRAAGSKGRGS